MRAWLADFRGAVGFLTVLPVGPGASFRPERMSGFFPVVGLLLGLIVAGVDILARFLWPDPLAALVVVLAWIVLTGALHVDGLADAGDGLFSHRSREQILAIMKDSRVGVMGVVCLAGILGLKWGGLWALPQERFLALILIPAYSGWACWPGCAGSLTAVLRAVQGPRSAFHPPRDGCSGQLSCSFLYPCCWAGREWA